MPNLRETLQHACQWALGGKTMKKVNENDIYEATTKQGNLIECDLDKFNYTRKFGPIRIVHVWFNRSSMKGSGFSRCPLIACEFLGANLTDASFSSAEKHKVLFDEAIAVDANFSRSSFHQCSFYKADLRHANFDTCALTRVDFRGAHLQGASFKGAHLEDCYFDPGWKMKNGLMVQQ